MARGGKGQRTKHVPQRTCIACREVAGKRGLVRLVRTDEGIVVDETGKMPGRGAYLHPSRRCWATALEGNRVQQALRTKFSRESDPGKLAVLAEQMQARAMEYVTYVPLGQYFFFRVYGDNVSGVIPSVSWYFWNIEKR